MPTGHTARGILTRMRQGQTPTEAELFWFAHGLATGAVSDAQAGAFAMAACRNGLPPQARVALTLAMRDSGTVLSWDLDAPVLDKHSTGGVGDCVSLILAPALAACGVYVPMISGRGLGHTGGTLDKLEAIPGVATQIDSTRLRAIVREVGCAIVGATAEIAPADQRLYAVRDVTATVDSVDLITASILSKKLASGLDGLVLDVKVGSGSFMKNLEAARGLATALVETARGAGCATSALITDMDQPLAASVGNALEVIEIMEVLSGAATGPLLDVTAALGGAVLAQSGLAQDAPHGADLIAEAIARGAALERFAQMISALGGPRDFAENWGRLLPRAAVVMDVPAERAGYVASVDGEALGLAVIELGGGRKVEADRVNPAVGIAGVARIGAKVQAGAPLARVHATDHTQAEAAAAAIRAAIRLQETPAQPPLLIKERID